MQSPHSKASLRESHPPWRKSAAPGAKHTIGPPDVSAGQAAHHFPSGTLTSNPTSLPLAKIEFCFFFFCGFLWVFLRSRSRMFFRRDVIDVESVVLFVILVCMIISRCYYGYDDRCHCSGFEALTDADSLFARDFSFSHNNVADVGCTRM